MKTLVFLVLLVPFCMASSCSNLPPVEFCYVHPKYGQVCVKVGGKVYTDPKLTDAQRKEVEEWLKTQ